MSRKIGAFKRAAKMLGISFDEYMAHIRDGEKHCGKCRTWKSLGAFHIDNSRGDGHATVCIECRRVKNPRHWLRGKSMPEEIKHKISETLKERYRNQPHHSIGNTYHLGIKHTEETRNRIAKITRERTPRGEKHYAYKDGKYARRHENRRTPEYAKWRRAVFERDKYTCQRCEDNKGGNLNAHHIKPFSEFPELWFDIDNGVTLCEDCHIDIHRGPRQLIPEFRPIGSSIL